MIPSGGSSSQIVERTCTEGIGEEEDANVG